MTKHTPTPWVVIENKRLGMIKINHKQPCEFGDTSDIAQIFTSLDEEKDRGNADFIVRACNNHHSLLNALEELLKEFEELYETFDPEGEIAVWGEWSEMARKAINDAKGE